MFITFLIPLLYTVVNFIIFIGLRTIFMGGGHLTPPTPTFEK